MEIFPLYRKYSYLCGHIISMKRISKMGFLLVLKAVIYYERNNQTFGTATE